MAGDDPQGRRQQDSLDSRESRESCDGRGRSSIGQAATFAQGLILGARSLMRMDLDVHLIPRQEASPAIGLAVLALLSCLPSCSGFSPLWLTTVLLAIVGGEVVLTMIDSPASLALVRAPYRRAYQARQNAVSGTYLLCLAVLVNQAPAYLVHLLAAVVEPARSPAWIAVQTEVICGILFAGARNRLRRFLLQGLA